MAERIKRAMFVDDHVHQHGIFQRIVIAAGLNDRLDLAFETDTRQALSELQTHGSWYDFVFVDVTMGEGEGIVPYDLSMGTRIIIGDPLGTKLARSVRHYTDAKFVCVAQGHRSHELDDKGLFDHYIHKPLDRRKEELRRIVNA